jgi:hypothetical protein
MRLTALNCQDQWGTQSYKKRIWKTRGVDLNESLIKTTHSVTGHKNFGIFEDHREQASDT